MRRRMTSRERSRNGSMMPYLSVIGLRLSQDGSGLTHSSDAGNRPTVSITERTDIRVNTTTPRENH